MNMFLRLSEETLIIFYKKQGLPFIIKGNNLFFSLGTYYIYYIPVAIKGSRQFFKKEVVSCRVPLLM